jgi:hypothetical protein
MVKGTTIPRVMAAIKTFPKVDLAVTIQIEEQVGAVCISLGCLKPQK